MGGHPADAGGRAAGRALWAGVAAWLKLRFGISEIISTIMLNFIAEYFVLFLARRPSRILRASCPRACNWSARRACPPSTTGSTSACSSRCCWCR
ncbi:MAG: hypothetical protein R3A10_08270 [Caldilineaceae bacterium]